MEKIKSCFFVFFVLLASVISFDVFTSLIEEEYYKIDNSRDLFSKLDYTPSPIIPFWFWNGNITEENIVLQIELMNSIGIKEVIIHARSGLEQEYLSEDWFRLIRFTLEELNNTGMKAWIYDDYDWPSGRAKGLVLKQNPNLGAKALKTEKIKSRYLESADGIELIAVVDSSSRKVNQLSKYCNMQKCDFGDDFHNKEIIIFYKDYIHYQTEYTLEPYVDVLDLETTSLFINLTHEKYYARNKDFFGKTLIGFFTDEPGFYNYGYDERDFNSIPWTDDFKSYFLGKKGYDITKYLYFIWYEDSEFSRQIKKDYFEVLSDMYSENYFGTMHKWTYAHEVLLTGHVLVEESIPEILVYQGDYFKTAKYLDIPGTDDIFYFDENKITPNLGTSAAYLFDKPFTMSETFGGYGEDLTYDEVLNVTAWLVSNGVDIIVPHAFFYTTEGGIQSKDYPPSFFYQNVKLWPNMKNYVSRLNTIQKAKFQPKHVVIYPIQEAWSLYNPSNLSKIDALDKKMKAEIKALILKNESFLIIPDYMTK